jgi:hypothetical protein
MFLDKINVGPVVADHVKTLRDYRTGKQSITDLLMFFGVPVAAAVAAVWAGIQIRVSAITAILTASALFIGLLPNLLILVLQFLNSTKGSDAADLQLRKRFMREIATHVSFSFVLSLALAGVATGALFSLPRDEKPVATVFTFLLVDGSATLLLTLLMLIRRMYKLVDSEFERHKFQKNAA